MHIRRLAVVLAAALLWIAAASAQVVPGWWGPGGPYTHATWNPADKSLALSLSGSNLTVTRNPSGDLGSIVRATTSFTTGKIYFENTYSQLAGSSTDTAIGFANENAALSDTMGNLKSIGYYPNGAYLSSDGGATLDSYAAGDVIGTALDVDGRVVWFRKGAGNWNANPSANPATGTGGIPVVTLFTTGSLIFAAWGGATNTQSATVNLGGSAFGHAAPVGFSAYGP